MAVKVSTYTNGLIFNATALDENLSSLIIDARGKTTMGLVFKWTGNLVGTLALFCCDDPSALGSFTGWNAVNGATFTTVITTGGGDEEDDFATPHAYYRIDFSYTSGEGDLIGALNTT
jgi:hypothetical protein